MDWTFARLCRLMYLIFGLIAGQVSATVNNKIIVDVDLHHFADDHEALVMLVNMQKMGVLDLLGVTLVAGNHRLDQVEVDTLKLIEDLGMDKDIPVYRGSERPLLHSEEVFQRFDKQRYASEYAGAWTESKILKEPVGGMPKISVETEHAVNFIIKSVRENPNQITLVALGPLSNIALAFRMAPDIISKIKSIIYMGGTAYAPGNVTPSAEFNWWFDPEAAKIVLSEPLDHVVIPLDATDKILFNINLYTRFVNAYPTHRMTTQYLKPKFKERFDKDPKYTIPVWDALVPAYLFDSSLAVELKKLWLTLDVNSGPNYGRAIVLPVRGKASIAPFQGGQPASVVITMDESKFWDVYEKLIFQVD